MILRVLFFCCPEGKAQDWIIKNIEGIKRPPGIGFRVFVNPLIPLRKIMVRDQ